MPLSFYGLPAELREVVWSESIASLTDGIPSSNSNIRSVRLTEYGSGGIVGPTEAMTWLQTISLVSRQFSADGRRHFFAAFKRFSLQDRCRTQGTWREKQRPGLANLRRFLRCVGAADARFVRSMDVHYYLDQPHFTSAAAGRALNGMGVQRWKGLRGAEVRLWYLIDLREGDAAYVFRVDDRGQFVCVKTLYPEF